MSDAGSRGARSNSSVWAVVPAAGTGSRMRDSMPKQYMPLAGKRLAEHTLAALLAVTDIRETVVAIAADDPHWQVLPQPLRERVRVVVGGPTRAASVLNALHGFSAAPEPDDWVLVHDMARPCIRPQQIIALMDELAADAVGGLLALPLTDTLKRVDDTRRVVATLSREALWRAQTPQMFRFDALERALREALEAGVEITDEAMAIERLGLCPRLVPGSEDNIKITHPEDLALAEHHLSRHGGLS